MNKYFNHFKIICRHKWYVFLACRDCGIIWRGIKHDMSKFSFSEFFEYAKNYEDGRSPVEVCKNKYGYCKAWLHHRGHNSHHWEYWIDNLYKGGEPIRMPYKDLVEMICDWIGASKAYNPNKWNDNSNYDWWISKRDTIKVHPDTQKFIDKIMTNIKFCGWEETSQVLRYNDFNY